MGFLRRGVRCSVFGVQSAGKVLFRGLLIALIPAVCSAQAFIEQISPPVLQRGKTCRVQLIGTEMDQAVGLWTSIPSGTMQATPVGPGESGQVAFDVQLPADAPLGLYGLRLATRSGLSNVHLFLVDELPVVQRSVGTLAAVAGTGVGEAAGSADANEIMRTTLPACIAAPCRKAQVDRYAIDVTAGQRVSFEVVGNRLGMDYDPFVTIRNSQGRILAQDDNDPGLFFDCRFEHTFAEAGSYFVEVRDARYEGNPYWNYVLRMGDFPVARVTVPSAVRPGQKNLLTLPQSGGIGIECDIPADRALGSFFQELRFAPGATATWVSLTATDLLSQVEQEPNHTREAATAVTVPGALQGVLAKSGEEDWFVFPLEKGDSILVQGEARSFGSPADLELSLHDQTGRELSRVDDVGLEEGNFSFNAGQPGQYALRVRDLSRDGGPAFAYRVEVRKNGPRLQLASEVSDLTVPQRTFQPIPLTVIRTGFQGPLELSLVGAPAGLTLEPATIPAEANDIVCRLSAAESAAPGLYTIQIVARGQSGEIPVQAAARTQPMIDRQLKNVDLITFALREEQRRLPPSLTDRLAVMITPPSPFSIELSEQLVLLPRYQQATFPIAIARTPECQVPISFEVKGGQIGIERQERHQIYCRFSPATPEQSTATGTFYTRILTALAKHRVDLSATAIVDGRKITLTRNFTLDVKSAFDPKVEPMPLALDPGGTIKFTMLANRVPTFDGPFTLTPTRQAGLLYAESYTVPAGQPGVEIEVKAAPDIKPGKYRIRFPARGFVGKYEEEIQGQEVEIEIKQPPKTS